MAVATGSIPVAPTIASAPAEDPVSAAFGQISASLRCSLEQVLSTAANCFYQDGLPEKLAAACETRSSGEVSGSNLYVVPTADWLTRSP